MAGRRSDNTDDEKLFAFDCAAPIQCWRSVVVSFDVDALETRLAVQLAQLPIADLGALPMSREGALRAGLTTAIDAHLNETDHVSL